MVSINDFKLIMSQGGLLVKTEDSRVKIYVDNERKVSENTEDPNEKHLRLCIFLLWHNDTVKREKDTKIFIVIQDCVFATLRSITLK